jgi:hypothetical protein
VVYAHFAVTALPGPDTCAADTFFGARVAARRIAEARAVAIARAASTLVVLLRATRQFRVTALHVVEAIDALVFCALFQTHLRWVLGLTQHRFSGGAGDARVGRVVADRLIAIAAATGNGAATAHACELEWLTHRRVARTLGVVAGRALDARIKRSAHRFVVRTRRPARARLDDGFACRPQRARCAAHAGCTRTRATRGGSAASAVTRFWLRVATGIDTGVDLRRDDGVFASLLRAGIDLGIDRTRGSLSASAAELADASRADADPAADSCLACPRSCRREPGSSRNTVARRRQANDGACVSDTGFTVVSVVFVVAATDARERTQGQYQAQC